MTAYPDRRTGQGVRLCAGMLCQLAEAAITSYTRAPEQLCVWAGWSGEATAAAVEQACRHA